MTPAARGGAQYIPSLDGLRCVAILPVFLSHVLQAAQVPNLFPGNFGVTLFFFLSGYLITTLMRMERERTGTVDLRLFYLRRILRIFPTFYLVLAATACFGLATGASDPWWILGQVLHVTNYQIIEGGWNAPIAPHTSVFWSLAVEEHFYVAFPAVYMILARLLGGRSIARVLFAVCALVFVWRCVLTYAIGAPPDRTYLATDTRIDSILFGCILAVWGNPVLDETAVPERTWKRVWLPLATAAVLLSFVGPRSFRETFGYSMQGIAMFAWFVTAIRYPEWGVMRLLNQRWMKWIGGLSYAIYLIHPAMIAVAQHVVGDSLGPLLLASTVLTVAASAALFYVVELPVGRIRKRLSVLARTSSSPKSA